MIEKLDVNNFRCFDEFTADNLAPITIIGGSNNSGKSTLLEAALVNYAVGNIGVYWSLVNIRNGYVPHPMLPQQVWGPLFNNKTDVNTLSICSSWENGDFTEFELTKIFDSGIQQQVSDTLSAIGMRFKSQQYEASGKCIIQNDMMQNNRIVFQSDDGHEIKSDEFNRIFGNCILYKGVPYDSRLPERISKMILDNEKKELIIHVLQKFEKNIVDIRTVLDNGMSYIYVIPKQGEPLPINYMGDGINKALLIISNILSLKNGVLLIDEIENGFYYELYGQLMEVFCETALKNKCQLIMTTHNLDVIESALDSMEKFDSLDDLCYQRIDISRRTGKRMAKSFSGKALAVAFESNMEIR